jgi:hypothetical protein
MFTKITFATAVIATTIVAAATVLGSQSTSDPVTKISRYIAAQGWCSGPRQHIDFRCS